MRLPGVSRPSALTGAHRTAAFPGWGAVDGRIPMSPIGHLTGLRAKDGAVGAATFSMTATPWLVGSQGLIAGGTLAILADSPLAAAIGSALPPQTGIVTSELSLRILRPVRAGGGLVAYGTLVHGGRSLGLSHVRIIDTPTRRAVLQAQTSDSPSEWPGEGESDIRNRQRQDGNMTTSCRWGGSLTRGSD